MTNCINKRKKNKNIEVPLIKHPENYKRFSVLTKVILAGLYRWPSYWFYSEVDEIISTPNSQHCYLTEPIGMNEIAVPTSDNQHFVDRIVHNTSRLFEIRDNFSVFGKI